MHAKSAVAAGLLAAAPLARASGSATISNACSFPVYLWTVANTPGTMVTIPAGSQHTEGYIINPDGGGVSMKLATTSDEYTAQITQFEYTLTDTLWYDISNINGNPFMQWGMTLTTSESSCRNVLCVAGVETCSQAYHTPTDDWATAACDANADTSLILCSGQNNDQNPVTSAVGNVLAAAHGDNKSEKHHKHHKEHKDHKHHKEHKHHDKPAPAPAPVPTVAPVPAPVANAAGPLTTFVTQVVTVTQYKRDAEPSAAAEPRAAFHRHHFHRHGHMES